MPSAEVPRPPKPPQTDRRFAPALPQIIGMGVLLVIVLLALLDVFGVVRTEVVAEQGPLQVQVRYPERFRYKTIDTIDVTVTNTGDAALQDIAVRFDRPYVDAFSTVTFTPRLDDSTAEVYEVVIEELPAGARQQVSVEIQAEAYWRHAGTVSVAVPAATVRAELATLVLP